MRKKDNLTHWDRYAAGYTGVCIGFNISALRVHMQRLNSTAFGMGLYDVGKIFYGPEQRKIQKKFEEINRAMTFGRKKVLFNQKWYT